jgi:hypothetical protein
MIRVELEFVVGEKVYYFDRGRVQEGDVHRIELRIVADNGSVTYIIKNRYHINSTIELFGGLIGESPGQLLAKVLTFYDLSEFVVEFNALEREGKDSKSYLMLASSNKLKRDK